MRCTRLSYGDESRGLHSDYSSYDVRTVYPSSVLGTARAVYAAAGCRSATSFHPVGAKTRPGSHAWRSRPRISAMYMVVDADFRFTRKGLASTAFLRAPERFLRMSNFTTCRVSLFSFHRSLAVMEASSAYLCGGLGEGHECQSKHAVLFIAVYRDYSRDYK